MARERRPNTHLHAHHLGCICSSQRPLAADVNFYLTLTRNEKASVLGYVCLSSLCISTLFIVARLLIDGVSAFKRLRVEKKLSEVCAQGLKLRA